MRVDFLVLADSVQVVGEKLYMLGGGWRFVHAQKLPADHPMGVGLGVLVDWMETNRRHDFTIKVINEDSKQSLFSATGQFEQGRPPGIPEGIEQRLLVALNFSLKLESAGQYAVVATIGGTELAHTAFMVVAPRAG